VELEAGAALRLKREGGGGLKSGACFSLWELLQGDGGDKAGYRGTFAAEAAGVG